MLLQRLLPAWAAGARRRARAAAAGPAGGGSRARLESVASTDAAQAESSLEPPPQRTQRSLFGEILDWMLAPLLVLWPMSLGLTWVVAQSIAGGPFDRALADVALALARQAGALELVGQSYSDSGRMDMQRIADHLTGAEDSENDHVYYQVLGRQGELVAGDAVLTVPGLYTVPGKSVVRFRDELRGEEPVRVAYLWLRDRHGEKDSLSLVQVAETLGKRSRLTTEIIKGVILPQFIILPLAVLLVWLALARGIRPLADLQKRIRRRPSSDLSPIEDEHVPEEVAPLVAAINDLLQRLDKSIATQRHFLADAAHQLKTPLAGLRTQAELAARDIDSGRSDEKSMRHSLLQIARSSQRAANVVDQLLTMARAEDGGGALRRVPLDLAALTRAVVRDFVADALERRIDLGYEGPESAPRRRPGRPASPTGDGPAAELAAGAALLRVLGEPVLLGELVRNLVENALHYTPAGGSVTVRILPDPFGQVVVLQVEDTGPGIPADERESVFRPFYRAAENQVDGSGLGLAIVQEIALRHGATVELGDARLPGDINDGGGVGARFTLRFAVLQPETLSS